MFYARKLFPGRHDASVVLPHMLEGSYNYFMKASQSAADILKQNIMIAGLRKGFNAYAAAMNDPAGLNLITTEQSLAKMRLSHQASYHLASEMLPQLNTVLMLLCISLFPIMALALFVREITAKVIINYLNIMGSLMLWPVMFAIFNHVYNFMMATTLNGENVSFSDIQNLDDLQCFVSLLGDVPIVKLTLQHKQYETIAAGKIERDVSAIFDSQIEQELNKSGIESKAEAIASNTLNNDKKANTNTDEDNKNEGEVSTSTTNDDLPSGTDITLPWETSTLDDASPKKPNHEATTTPLDEYQDINNNNPRKIEHEKSV